MTNINDLTEDQLNTLAALGQGLSIDSDCADLYVTYPNESMSREYDPCNNGSQAMELVEEYPLVLGYADEENVWRCQCLYGWVPEEPLEADNPKLAIVRAFVASKFGTEIDYEKIVETSATGGE